MGRGVFGKADVFALVKRVQLARIHGWLEGRMTLASYIVALCIGAAGGWLVRSLFIPEPPLIVQCAWCGKIQDWGGAQVSHGICRACAEAVDMHPGDLNRI